MEKLGKGLVRRVALTTALAGVFAGGYGYRERRAWAGDCTGSGGTYTCSGAADPANDVMQVLNPGGPLTVTTTPGFGIHAAGGQVTTFAAIKLTGYGGLEFIDEYNSPITAKRNGIHAVNDNSGDLLINITGPVTGVRKDGIYALTWYPGLLSITATDTVTGFEQGIDARARRGGDVTIDVVDVTGSRHGIRVAGDVGAISITSTGTVEGGSGYTGIAANGTGIEINANNVTGGDSGIHAFSADGNVEITVTGTVQGAPGRR